MSSVRGRTMASRWIRTRTALPPIGSKVTTHNVGLGPSWLPGHYCKQIERNDQLGIGKKGIGQTKEIFQGKEQSNLFYCVLIAPKGLPINL